jgi:hypothetical protein
MRTIRRQVYARDRRLALLQLRQGKCRCAVTVRTSAGCPRRGCASPTRRTFRPVVARISRKPYLDSSNFRLLHCTIYYFALQRKLHGLSTGFPLAEGDLGATWRRLGSCLAAARATGRRGTERGNVPQSLMCHRPVCGSPHISAPITAATACGRRRSMSTRLSRSRQTPGIFCVDIWLQGDAANIANFPCSSALMSPK